MKVRASFSREPGLGWAKVRFLGQDKRGVEYDAGSFKFSCGFYEVCEACGRSKMPFVVVGDCEKYGAVADIEVKCPIFDKTMEFLQERGRVESVRIKDSYDDNQSFAEILRGFIGGGHPDPVAEIKFSKRYIDGEKSDVDAGKLSDYLYKLVSIIEH